MLRLREQAKHFVCLLVVRIAAAGVASWALLSAQTVLNTRTLSGAGTDTPTAIATDSQGNVYLAGSTNSPDFPLTRALFAQLAEPALRISPDGRTFTGAASPGVPEVDAVAASGDGRLVLAGTPAGLYRSTDSGGTWAASPGLTGQILAAAISPLDSNTAYSVVLTTNYSGSPVGPVANRTWTIYKSGDGGNTWQTSASYTLSPYTGATSQIWINPQNPSIVYAFVNSSLLQTSDAGAHWTQIQIPAAKADNGLTSPTGFAIAPSQPNIAYASTYYFPFMKSVDGGATWQFAAAIGSAGENAIAVDPQSAAVVWLVNGVGIYKSTDGAATFEKVASMGDGSWQSIAVSNRDSSIVFASDQHNVYATFDGGSTWTLAASGQIKGVFAIGGEIYVAASVSPTVFLTKFDPTLSQILYSTFLGPGGVSRMAVDAAGNVYVAGSTQSHSFPTTPGALGRDFVSSSAGFVSKVRADGGSLVYSTLLDGMRVLGLALDAAGSAVVVGAAAGALPVTRNAMQSSVPGACTRTPSSFGQVVQIGTHAFAAKLNGDGSAYAYATWVTGSCGDAAYDIALDSSGAPWIGGQTYSIDFPTTPDAIATTFPTISNAGFVAHLSANGDKLLYSTYVGAGDAASVNALVPDSQGNLIAAGSNQGQATPGSYEHPPGGCPPIIGFFSIYSTYPRDDGFVMKLSPASKAPVFLATIGGSCHDSINHMALDPAGNIWVTGRTDSSDFATIAPLSGLGWGAGSPGFLAALDASGAALLTAGISNNAGALAAGPGGTLYFTEAAAVAGKAGTAAVTARIDASQRPAIFLDAIHSFGPGLPIAPSYVPFAVAPGQVVRLAGRGIGPDVQADAATAAAHVLPEIAGVQVTFNGIAAQLVSVQANQIVCIAPFALDGAATADVQVAYNGSLSNPYSIGVVPQNADVVAIANPDGSPNSQSNPVEVNGVVTIYLTGLGQTNPPSMDGALNLTPFVSPIKTPSISVNNIPEAPVFLGAAPGQVAGIMQMNLFMPNPGSGGVNNYVYVNSTFMRVWVRPQP